MQLRESATFVLIGILLGFIVTRLSYNGNIDNHLDHNHGEFARVLPEAGTRIETTATVPVTQRPLKKGGVAPHFFQGAEDFFNDKPDAKALSACVIVRTYKGQRSRLLPLLVSIAASGHWRTRIILVDTNPGDSFDGIHDFASAFNALVGQPIAVVSNRTSADGERLYPKMKINDHGYLLTDLVINDIIAERANHPADANESGICDVLHVTNGDNLYNIEYFRSVLFAIAEGMDMVATHFVSRYYWPSHYYLGEATGAVPIDEPEWKAAGVKLPYKECGPFRPGQDVELAVSFRPRCIDIAAVSFRATLLESSGIRFITDELDRNPTGEGFGSFEADGNFFHRLGLVPGVKHKVLRRALVVHQ